MVKSDSVRLLLSADYASIANYWKFFIGQTEQLKRMKVVDEKVATEKLFAAFAKGKPEYENVLSNFENAYKAYNPYALHNTFMREGVSGSSLIAYASSYMQLEKALKAEKPDQAQIDKLVAQIKTNGEEF